MNELLDADTPLFIVANAASGSRDGEASRRTIQRVLSEAGRRHQLFEVPSSSGLRDVSRRAVDAAVREQGAIVVAGGDGTINCVAHAALSSGRPFGIVPQGTFNYSSRAHGIPLETEPAVRALLNAKLKPLQVGRVNDRIFLVNASLGLYPQLLQDREHYKRELGRKRSVAALAALVTLLREDVELMLEIERAGERERVQACTLFVGNNPLQLDRVGLPEATDVEQRRLAAVLVPPVSPVERIALALRAALGKLGGAEEVRDFAFRSLTVRPAGRAPRHGYKIAVDGEVQRMQPPITFSLATESLPLMTPAS